MEKCNSFPGVEYVICHHRVLESKHHFIIWTRFNLLALPGISLKRSPTIHQYTRYHLSEHYILQFIQTLISQSDDKVFAQLIVRRNGYIRENYGTFLGQIVTYELGSFVGPGNLPYLRGGPCEKINFG